MSQGAKRLGDPAARWAFDQWRQLHPHGSIDQFFRRPECERGWHRQIKRLRHQLEIQTARLADTTLPDDVRKHVAANVEQLKKWIAEGPRERARQQAPGKPK